MEELNLTIFRKKSVLTPQFLFMTCEYLEQVSDLAA